MAISDDDDSLSSSSASSSDDEEYLTISKGDGSGKHGSEDREAMIRRKLLESFYGSSAPATSASPKSSNEAETTGASATTSSTTQNTSTGLGSHTDVGTDRGDSTSSSSLHHSSSIGTSTNAAATATSKNDSTSTDLDSPNFGVFQHNQSHIQNSTTHELLTTNENIALSVRLLDSKMQTLVYENYSKFINATDAIQSIGLSVNSSEGGLAQLKAGMERMEVATIQMDNALRQSREAVAEKLRVKRLLARLTRLLELPSTLDDLVRKQKKYRLAISNYLDAIQILEKHSKGFESLRSIELECNDLVKDMVRTLAHKIGSWCGVDERGRRRKALYGSNSATTISRVLDQLWSTPTQLLDNDANAASGSGQSSSNGQDCSRFATLLGYKKNPKSEDDRSTADVFSLDIPQPESISEIFECTGALFYFCSSPKSYAVMVDDLDDDSAMKEDSPSSDSMPSPTPLLTDIECKAIALECCTKYLEHILEEHAVDVQQARFNEQLKKDGAMPSPNKDSTNDESSSTNALVPTNFLDCVLEIATLFGITFRHSDIDANDAIKDSELLNERISSWVNLFLSHVRNMLVEMTMEQESENDRSSEDMVNDIDDGDAAFAEVSYAMTQLVRSVRETASGLALPEIGLDMELASSLVEQTVCITEGVVRKRVAQIFHTLKMRVLREAIVPFVRDTVGTINKADEDTSHVKSNVTDANATLSDSMQFADDTIRSILSIGSTARLCDIQMVKSAVRKNSRKFAIWLANTLEVLAGCDLADQSTLDLQANIEDVEMEKATSTEEAMLRGIYDDLDCADDESLVGLNLSILEICRLAERNIPTLMNQSISSSLEDEKKASGNEFFSSIDPTRKSTSDLDSIDSDGLISSRFRLAASRSLNLYALTKGSDAAVAVCDSLLALSSQSLLEVPHGPTEIPIKVLEIAKSTSLKWAELFGGDKMAGPVPNFMDDSDAMMYPQQSLGIGNAKGLQLDVARMFTEKVQIYPNAQDVVEDFSRDYLVTLLLKVSFKAWMEQSRYLSYSLSCYRQAQVDVEFIKFMLPHYVGEDSAQSLIQLLNDVLLSIGERCASPDQVGITEFYDDIQGKVLTPYGIVLSYLAQEDATGDKSALRAFIIPNE